MIDLIATATAGVWPYLVIAFTVVVGYITAWFKGRSSGKKEAAGESNAKALDNAKKAKEAENEADKIDDVDSALRDNDWVQ